MSSAQGWAPEKRPVASASSSEGSSLSPGDGSQLLFQQSRPGVVSREELTSQKGVRSRVPLTPCPPPVLCSRYSPHQDADPLKPREPAIIKHFTAYKNQDHGAWLRGGDVWLDSCR